MASGWVRSLGAAALFFCLGAASASAQSDTRIGWLPALAGACYEARNSAGVVVDQQCYQMQFGHVVRAAITRGEYRGESVLGYNRDRSRLEMYAWGNQDEPSIFTPTFNPMTAEYVFEGATEDGVATRSVWRHVADGFDVVSQRREGGSWTDASTVSYRRTGEAPRVFSAGASPGVTRYGLGWLDQIAGRCYFQTQPTRDRSLRGCFTYQYTNALRQTWYANSDTPTGEAMMFRRPNGSGVRFFHWDASGGFGIGESIWVDNQLISTTDARDRYRTVMRRSGNGFEMTTERIAGGAVRDWEFVRQVRYTMQ